MYLWRKLTRDQRQELQSFRQINDRPWHSPTHRVGESGRYLLTGSCYEHHAIVGHSPERLAAFSKHLLATLEPHCAEVNAWCVLPNHYHALVRTELLADLLHDIGRLHGRISFDWNGEDQRRGRKVWFNCVETAMKSERHFRATLNYVHHNPVYHGYVRLWHEWPFSSASAFLGSVGREQAEKLWREFPLLDYGKDWDPPDL